MLVVAIVIIALLGGVFFISKKPATPNVPVPAISGDTIDLVSLSIKPGDVVTEGEVITGTLKGNYFFEATARAGILDKDKNWMTGFPIQATSDWMTEGSVDFKMVVSYAVDDTPVNIGGPGYLRIMNDNPSGERARDKFIDIPVIFK